MLLSDPEMESSILISSDEGATYQKYRLTFYIQSLLFHPKQEDWVLAYSLDQKVIKHCFHSQLVIQVPPGATNEKRLFTQSKFWRGFNDVLTKLTLSAATNFPFYSLVSKYAGRHISFIGNVIYHFTRLRQFSP